LILNPLCIVTEPPVNKIAVQNVQITLHVAMNNLQRVMRVLAKVNISIYISARDLKEFIRKEATSH